MKKAFMDVSKILLDNKFKIDEKNYCRGKRCRKKIR